MPLENDYIYNLMNWGIFQFFFSFGISVNFVLLVFMDGKQMS